MTEPPVPDLRASDADRERVAEQLRAAAGDGQLTVEELDERLSAAYAARTRADLAPLTADLQASPASGSAAPGFSVRPGDGGARWLVGVVSGCERRGRWRLGARTTSVNVLGGSELDLSEAELAAEEVQLRVYSIMGGAEIYVPPGMNVRVSQFALMGANTVDVPEAASGAPGPTVHLRLFALMGGNEVKRGPKRSRRKRRALARAERDRLNP